jgi:hypothetical protein
MDIVEHLVRSFARRISKDGHVALISNGHPALVKAFQHLGWADPYVDPDLLPETPKPVVERDLKTATVEAPERAVLPRAKGRLGGL